MLHLLSAQSLAGHEWHGPVTWHEFSVHVQRHLLSLPTHDEGILNCLLVLLAGFALAYAMLRWGKARRWLIDHLMGCAMVLFVLGVGLYVVGFNHEGTAQNATALLLRSMTASMEMFVSESELIEVDETVKCNMAYMTLFAIVHFLAVCVSAAFILHLLGARAASFVRMHWLSNVLRPRNKDVHVFFDFSEESMQLAADIHRHYHDRHDLRHCRIIFVRTPAAESHMERFSFAHILSLSSDRNDRVEQLMQLDAFITYSRRNVDLTLDDHAWQHTVGLRTLRNYLERRARRVRFFCLTADEDANLSTAQALSDRYATFTDELHQAKRLKDGRTVQVDVFCHVHRSPLARTIAAPRLHLIDTASLAVIKLKEKLDNQPVAYVPINAETAGVERPFRALIVGFGATGTEMLKYLYEFSSFVDSSGHAVKPHITIIDPAADARRDAFFTQCPAFEGDNSLEFLNGTIESLRHRVADLLGRKADEAADNNEAVDYVAVCTHDDRLNIELGVQLMQQAFRHRDAQQRLGIYVSTYSASEHHRAQCLARFLNHCTGSGTQSGSGECQFSLRPFGAMSDIFTYDNLLSEQRLAQAMEFYGQYKLTASLYEFAQKDRSAGSGQGAQEWLDREQQTDPSQLSQRNSLVQNECQDLGNVWHMLTKLALVGITSHQRPEASDSEQGKEALRQWQRIHDEENDRCADLYGCIGWVMKRLQDATLQVADGKAEKFDTYGFILSRISDYEQQTPGLRPGSYLTLFVNLARCEHLRWWAMNKALGYVGPDNLSPQKLHHEKDYIRLRHWCMVPCPLMDCVPGLRNTLKYDFNTLLVTLKMEAQRRGLEQPSAPFAAHA